MMMIIVNHQLLLLAILTYILTPVNASKLTAKFYGLPQKYLDIKSNEMVDGTVYRTDSRAIIVVCFNQKENIKQWQLSITSHSFDEKKLETEFRPISELIKRPDQIGQSIFFPQHLHALSVWRSRLDPKDIPPIAVIDPTKIRFKKTPIPWDVGGLCWAAPVDFSKLDLKTDLPHYWLLKKPRRGWYVTFSSKPFNIIRPDGVTSSRPPHRYYSPVNPQRKHGILRNLVSKAYRKPADKPSYSASDEYRQIIAARYRMSDEQMAELEQYRQTAQLMRSDDEDYDSTASSSPVSPISVESELE
jgi:hypothetical protein